MQPKLTKIGIRSIVPIVSIVVPFVGFNQFYIKDPKKVTQKGPTMETIGSIP